MHFRKSITPNVKNDIEILHTFFSLFELYEVLKEDPLDFVASFHMIPNFKVCDYCGSDMLLYKNRTRLDGFIWKCGGNCLGSISIRTNSFFAGSKLCLKNLVLLLYMWSNEYDHVKIKNELKINKNTVVTWANNFRELCGDFVVSENSFLGGLDEDGNPLDVEIDESLFFKRKFNRGRLGSPIWVFAAIERLSGKCFFVPVESRDSNTLMEIINQKILPGSRIISDQWASYRGIASSGVFEHATVNHSRNFVSPLDPSVHTQNVESLWSQVKRKLRIQYGTSSDLFESYFFEFIVRKRCKKENFNMFNYMCFLIKELH